MLGGCFQLDDFVVFSESELQKFKEHQTSTMERAEDSLRQGERGR